MDSSSNNSFIPKQGTKKNRHKAKARQVHVFTFLSYTFLFATLIATAASYFYASHVEKNLVAEVSMLTEEISNFNEADMQRVLEFDRRLTQASGRLNATISLVSIFEALEVATINNVLIDSLSMERIGDDLLQVSAQIKTDSFDSTLFQRGVYDRNQTIGSVEIVDVLAVDMDTSLGISQSISAPQRLPTVTFNADFEIPLSDIPYVPSQGLPVPPVMEILPLSPQPAEEVSVMDATSTAEQADNNENI